MLLAQAADKVANFDNLLRIKSHGGLVQDEHGRIAEQSLRKADALAVTL